MLLLFISFPIIEGFAFSEPLLSGIFVNRFLFIPALLTNFYFDYFKDNPFFFAESHFFNLFVKNPYNMPVGFLITKEYWGEPTAYANNGIISDGFMNLGYLGVFLFSIIFMIIFAFFNSTKINKVYFGIFFYYLFLILSTPFLSAFITGGMGIFIIFTVILLRDSKIQNTISSI
ncbi:MAG TPA: hypothetical protein VFL70_10195 [Bacteroidia bacterium]|nr:hypothetical protein [Bacteroidia bacterium]